MRKRYPVLLLVITLIILSVVTVPLKVRATSEIKIPKNSLISSRVSDNSNLGFDASAYKRYEAVRRIEPVYVSYMLALTSGISKGDLMGYCVVRSAVFVPNTITKADGSCRNIAVFECEMHAGVMNSNKYITSQSIMASVGFKSSVLKDAVMLPNSTMIDVSNTITSSRVTTTGFEIGGNYGVGLQMSTNISDVSVGGTSSWSTNGKYHVSKSKTVGLSMSYLSGVISLVTSDATGYKTWRYMYRITGNATTDGWAQGTTINSGMAEYTANSNKSMTGESISASLELHMGAEFYTGSKKGTVIKNNWTDPDIGVVNSTFKFYY